MLKKNEQLCELWKRRVGKMVAVLVLFSFIYYLRQIQVGNEEWSLKRFFLVLYDSDWNFAYWYIYVYIAMLITLPFLRALVSNLETKLFYYMIILAICFEGIIPILQFLLCQNQYSLNEGLEISWITTRAVLYPCVGYFVEYKAEELLRKKKIILLWICTFITIGISCYMTYYKMLMTGEKDMSSTQTFFNSFVLIHCITVYSTLKYFCLKVKIPRWCSRVLISVGGTTFTIYLLHILIMNTVTFEKVLYVFNTEWCMNDMFAICLYCCTVFVTGYVIATVFKLLPGLKKIL